MKPPSAKPPSGSSRYTSVGRVAFHGAEVVCLSCRLWPERCSTAWIILAGARRRPPDLRAMYRCRTPWPISWTILCPTRVSSILLLIVAFLGAASQNQNRSPRPTLDGGTSSASGCLKRMVSLGGYGIWRDVPRPAARHRCQKLPSLHSWTKVVATCDVLYLLLFFYVLFVCLFAPNTHLALPPS